MNLRDILLRTSLSIAVLAFASGFAAPAGAQLLDFQILQYPVAARFATASGAGRVHAIPDRAVVTLAVKNWNKDLRLAYSQNTADSKKVLGLASKYHIEAHDTQSSEVNVEPTYPEKAASSVISLAQPAGKPTGYQVERKITFVVKSTSTLPALLANAIDAGANSIQSITLETSNLRKLRDDARALAVRAAKEKAVAMAAELGARLGKVLIVRETGSDVTDLGSSSVRVNNLANLEALVGCSTSSDRQGGFAPGQLMISSSVTATFELIE